MTEQRQDPAQAARKATMAVLARAPLAELESRIASLGRLPAYERIKGPQTGTVMVEGRAGGNGQRFNIGEATVTRAVVRLENGVLGYGYRLGTDRRCAELSALVDALIQDASMAAAVERDVISPLAAAQAARRDAASRKAAATKVAFFTLVRGDG